MFITQHDSTPFLNTIRSLFIIVGFVVGLLSTTSHTAQLKSNLHIMGNEFPEPLPRSTSGPFLRTPYKNLYQGKRLPNDTRIFNKKFKDNATMIGNILHIEQVFDCILTHFKLETANNIPVLLRGGVGYRHLSAVVRAGPGDELSANATAFCIKPEIV